MKKIYRCQYCGGDIHRIIMKFFCIDVCNECNIAQTKPIPKKIDYTNNDFQAQFNFKNFDDLDPVWKKSILRQIDMIKRKLSKGSKILEIGCGQGVILNELKKNGYKVKGIEPSKEAAKRALTNGLDVSIGYFPDIKMSYSKFDAIISSHVFEHVENPHLFIKKINSMLADGGLLMFTQTNYLGLIPQVLKNRWYGWAPEQHYWHFSADGLRTFLEKNGYIHIETKYTSLVHPPSPLLFFANLFPRQKDQFHLLVKKQLLDNHKKYI